jgi:hypothetical protein
VRSHKFRNNDVVLFLEDNIIGLVVGDGYDYIVEIEHGARFLFRPHTTIPCIKIGEL